MAALSVTQAFSEIVGLFAVFSPSGLFATRLYKGGCLEAKRAAWLQVNMH